MQTLVFACMQQTAANSVSCGCVSSMGLYCVALGVGNVGYCFICTPQPPQLPVSEAAAVNEYKNANKFINLQGPLGQCMSAITVPS